MKIGRNEPCPCGSGKKFKKCCLLMIDEQQAIIESLEEREFQEWFKKDCEQGQTNLKAANEELEKRGVQPQENG